MSRREVELMEFVQDVRSVIRNEELRLEEASDNELKSFLQLALNKKISRLELAMIGAHASELYRRTLLLKVPVCGS